MRAAPNGVAELADNIRWYADVYLQIMEEVALNPVGPKAVESGKEHAMERIHRARECWDREAEDQAIIDYMRVRMRETWPYYPALQVLSDLYSRAARRKAQHRSPHSRRTPDLKEGEKLAEYLLAGVKFRGGLDTGHESREVSNTLVRYICLPTGEDKARALHEYIERSESSRAYYDALLQLSWHYVNCGKRMPEFLFFWSVECAFGVRHRPPLAMIAAHRPVDLSNFLRNVQMQIAIEILRRVGIAPRGHEFSGCEIVAKEMDLREETVIRIWKNRIWAKPMEPELRRYLEAVHERTGLTYDAEICGDWR